jgi:hypothetical protein
VKVSGPQAPVLGSYLVQIATVAPPIGAPAAPVTLPVIFPQVLGGLTCMLTPTGTRLDMTSGLFEAIWDRAVPLNRSDSKGDTVQRHIHELMEQVGARTRFQLGLEAASQGWL